jgi:hypothetical protein
LPLLAPEHCYSTHLFGCRQPHWGCVIFDVESVQTVLVMGCACQGKTSENLGAKDFVPPRLAWFLPSDFPFFNSWGKQWLTLRRSDGGPASSLTSPSGVPRWCPARATKYSVTVRRSMSVWVGSPSC